MLRSLKHGVDLETLHVDVCPQLELFKAYARPTPGAEATRQAVQIPVYESLSPMDVERVAVVVHDSAAHTRLSEGTQSQNAAH